MPNYTISVELAGDPPPEAYEALDDLMTEAEFFPTIETDGGVMQLPFATFYGISDLDAIALRDFLITQIRTNIQFEIAVLVAETLGVAVWGAALDE